MPKKSIQTDELSYSSESTATTQSGPKLPNARPVTSAEVDTNQVCPHCGASSLRRIFKEIFDSKGNRESKPVYICHSCNRFLETHRDFQASYVAGFPPKSKLISDKDGKSISPQLFTAAKLAPIQSPASPYHPSQNETEFHTGYGIQKESLKKKLEYYRDKLLQIEQRNRSVMLRRVYNKWSFDLAKLIIRGNISVENIVEKGVVNKKPICLISDSDTSELAEKDRTKLRSLFRNVTQIELETGLHETFFGFPFLVGHVGEDTYVRGPLILFPISIEYRNLGKPPGWYLTFPKDKPSLVNRAMLTALKKKGRLTVPDVFYEQLEGFLERFVSTNRQNNDAQIFKTKPAGQGQDQRYRTNIETNFLGELSKLLKKNGFEHKYLQENQKTEVLEALLREEEIVLQREDLRLVNYKIIGHFPQGDSAIYSDYEQLMMRAESGEFDQGIIDNLLEIPSSEDVWNEGEEGEEEFDDIDLDNIPTSNLNLVLESDASQEAAIIAAQSADCTVVRGPPGTGKSQAIVNLIANALSNQKKILVVCQKRAALDVVYQRLHKVGLSPYVALLHDATNDRAELYSHISKLLNYGSSPSSSSSQWTNESAESVEWKINQISQSIDKIISTQRTITSALSKKYFGGISAHELYVRAQPGYICRLDLSKIAQNLEFHELDEFINTIKRMEIGCKRFDNFTYPWYNRKNFSELTLEDKNRIYQIIQEILQKGNQNTMITMPDTSQQNQLVSLLNTLSSTTGILRKLKSSVKEANESARRLVNDPGFLSGEFNVLSPLSGGEIQLDLHLKQAKNGLDFWNSIAKLKEFMNDIGFSWITSDISSDILKKQELFRKLDSLKLSLENDFDDLRGYDQRKGLLTNMQKDVLELCRSKLLREDDWKKILEQEFYQYWIQFIENENKVLRMQPFETYVDNCRRLSFEVKKHRDLARLNISKQIETAILRPIRRSSGRRLRNNPELAMWTSLGGDLEKKRRVLPVRKLIEKYSQILFNVIPCWLVSPEAVASIFPLARNLFDYIIFDEASQLAVERSLTSLYRGKHIVIMGDEKQLRPFDLFKVVDEDDELDEESTDESMLSESLLVLAKRIYGYRYLVWHYRSKYQELIDFSNHAFYDGHLQVAPNILVTSNIPPIRWIKCENGLWENRQNLPEAHLLVNVLTNILEENQAEGIFRSVGVITFNEAQKLAILDEIDRRRRSDTKFDELYSAAENPSSKNLDDIPFVKNIENVQGDERDIIIFSVGYATDADGKLRVQFGTLNREGGENRLNVAITRARQEIMIVSSIEPDDLKTDPTKNMGPKRLKDYLKYAKYVSERDHDGVRNILTKLNQELLVDDDNNRLIFESAFEELVHERLLRLGYKVNTQVGHSGYRIDLAIVHPDQPSKYILGIECDGAMFHSAKSTRERDVDRQEFLEKRGWIIERIWSTNWWRNPEREIQRIKQRVEELRSKSLKA